MKRIILVSLSAVLVFSSSYAQEGHDGGLVAKRIEALSSGGARFVPVDLFKVLPRSTSTDVLWQNACKEATLVEFDGTKATELIAQANPFIRFALPAPAGSLELILERVDITTDDFSVIVASTGLAVEVAPAAHYRGMILGEPKSVVAISVFEDQVMGMISNASGDRVLGRLENDQSGYHILYNDQDLRATNNATCGANDDTYNVHGIHGNDDVVDASRTLKCVRYYWEVNYDIFQSKGNVAAATAYVTGLFNQTATLFTNDGIDVTLSEVFVWDVVSPYVHASTSAQLNQFGVTRTTFNGDMAHLLGMSGGGGIAWLNTLCSSQTRYRMAYSSIYASYSNVPTYSWSVEVVTHEQGHNLGSSHTHACAWNGDNTAIDGCGPTASTDYTEGSCATGPVPTSAVGGTIMSYCHLIGTGIKFVNGFGPQPAVRIVNAVNSASCLTACGNSCDAPGSLVATGVSTSAATLTWAAIGATTYTVQWKPTASGTWTTVTGVTGNTYPLTGLTQVTSYDFRVLSVCGASSSGYSATYAFSTLAPCPDIMEPNNSTATAGTVSIPANLNALLATSSDQDYYKVILGNAGTLTISLGNLAGDYDLKLLDNTGTQVAVSENGGTQSESISYVAVAGTFYVHVYGYNGAFSADQCYSLTIYASGQTCTPPGDLITDNVLYDGAQMNWASVQGATSYSVQYRVAPDGNWTTASPVTQSNLILTGLLASTAYNWRVAQLCQGEQPGGYSGIANFTTLTAPCEVAPTAVVALKVFLGGPFDGISLMSDALRSNNMIPSTEPYTAMGFAPIGTLVTDGIVFTTTGNNAIVDWVLVELRGTSAPYAVVETRAGLLQRDGDIVAVDGTSALGFCVNPGNYRVAVRHRNHLACMTGTSYALSSTATSIDLTTSSTSTYGTNARKTAGNLMLLWAGNTEPDQAVLYTGQNNDRDLILTVIGGVAPTNTVSGYLMTDVNMDGIVRYTGQNNDRDIILTNIGGVAPTASVVEQMP